MIEKSIEMARGHLSDPIHRWNALTMREDLERVLNDIEILLLSNYIDEPGSELADYKHAYLDAEGGEK
jgi:hypothetical protein